MDCHYCWRYYKWPCEGYLFHFKVKWSKQLVLTHIKKRLDEAQSGCFKKSIQDDPSMARRLSHQMPCSLSLGLAGQWTGVDIIRSETKPLSRLKLSKFQRDLNPHLDVIFRPGYGILSRYWNSHSSGTMIRHPHDDNIKCVGLGQWVLILYYLRRTVHYPHPVQSLAIDGCFILWVEICLFWFNSFSLTA